MVQISWSILLPNTSTEAAIRSAVFLLTVEDSNGIPRCIRRSQPIKVRTDGVYRKTRNSLFRDTGACLAPMNAYLNLIGMETLGLRMERQCSNALELAQWLEETYPSVTVNYPGLKSSNWYEISEKQFSRGYGAILTLRVGSKENAFALIDALKIPYTLSNIGDTKTLVIHPGSTISLHSSEQEKEDAGVFEDLIRVSVGIEDIEDLKADFAQAIEKIGQR